MCPTLLLLLAAFLAFVTTCRAVWKLLPLAVGAFSLFIDLCCMFVAGVARLALMCFRPGAPAAPLLVSPALVEARPMKTNRSPVPSFGRMGHVRPTAGRRTA